MYQAWDSRINRYVRFIHPIKTAGTSISQWMEDTYVDVIEWPHQQWINVPAPEDNTFTFTVFRNPWDRLESIYLELGRVVNDLSIVDARYGVTNTDYLERRITPRFNSEDWHKGFEYFVDIIQDESQQSRLEHTLPEGIVFRAHTSQLSHWPTDWPVHVLRFDNVSNDWNDMWKQFGITEKSLPHSKNYPHPESLHTARTRSVVEKIWEDDVSYFVSSRQDLYPIEK